MQSQLDHHVGKRVESVDREGAAWRIIFEDETVIASHKRAQVPAVEDLKLLAVQGCCGKYEMVFGKPGTTTPKFTTVPVEVGSYEINGKDPHEEIDEPLPDDPSVERVQEAPEENNDLEEKGYRIENFSMTIHGPGWTPDPEDDDEEDDEDEK